MNRYDTFYFESYAYDAASSSAVFCYSFDHERWFEEKVQFTPPVEYDGVVLDRALFLAFCVIGTSYYKCFPTRTTVFMQGELTPFQAKFCQTVYREGLSQFIFENHLELDSLVQFHGITEREVSPLKYSGQGVAMLQSGGKDSLLLAALAEEQQIAYTPLYITSGDAHPQVLDILAYPLRTVRRMVDRTAIQQAIADGGLNGHVPVTYIVEAIALIDAILHGQSTVLAAIGREGNEAHEYVGDLAVNHQWSKTWPAEQLMMCYVTTCIAPELQMGSPLRGLSELRIAELFVDKAWQRFGHSFSSCNRANYQQGTDNTTLTWCGECPKCANSFLLFAPFVEPEELRNLFGGKNLFVDSRLTETFKGLLGIGGVMKPFECIGEIDELRLAYHMARKRFGVDVYALSFDVPESTFDYRAIGNSQSWTSHLVAI